MVVKLAGVYNHEGQSVGHDLLLATTHELNMAASDFENVTNVGGSVSFSYLVQALRLRYSDSCKELWALQASGCTAVDVPLLLDAVQPMPRRFKCCSTTVLNV